MYYLAPSGKYIENTPIKGNVCDGKVWAFESKPFFPSLKDLRLEFLPELKGRWREGQITDSTQGHILPTFPHLSSLCIENCLSVTFIPPCPTLEQLELRGRCNGNLQIPITHEFGNSRLRSFGTTNKGSLKLIFPMKAYQGLKEMDMCRTWNQEPFWSCANVPKLPVLFAIL